MKTKPTLEIVYWKDGTYATRAYGTDLDIGVTDHTTDTSFMVLRLGQEVVVQFKSTWFSWCRAYDKKNKESAERLKKQKT